MLQIVMQTRQQPIKRQLIAKPKKIRNAKDKDKDKTKEDQERKAKEAANTAAAKILGLCATLKATALENFIDVRRSIAKDAPWKDLDPTTGGDFVERLLRFIDTNAELARKHKYISTLESLGPMAQKILNNTENANNWNVECAKFDWIVFIKDFADVFGRLSNWGEYREKSRWIWALTEFEHSVASKKIKARSAKSRSKTANEALNKDLIEMREAWDELVRTMNEFLGAYRH
jgi:hypothetical protein